MKSSVLRLFLVLVCWASCPARAAADANPGKPLQYFVIVTGGELLEGIYPDAHTPFLTRALRPLGCQCVGSLIVDDNRDDMQRALRFATNRAPVVLITGGLGPTPNDITRETLAEFTGIPLREDPEALAQLERRLGQTREQLRPNLRRQMLTPQRGAYLKNPHGTAVGLVFDAPGATIIALPGPPRELQPMVRDQVIPYLQRQFGVREFGCSMTIRFVGAGQSLIDQTIKDHVPLPPDVIVTSLFDASRVDFTFSLPGNTAADRQKLQQLQQPIHQRLAQYIYADDGASLEDVVGLKLKARGATLALVEIGSGASVAPALNASPTAAAMLAGAFAAPNEPAVRKLLQIPGADPAVSPEDRSKALANTAATRCQSNAALVVSPVNQDKEGQPALWLVLKLPDGQWETQRLPLRDSGEITRNSVTTQVLDFLRRRL